MIDESEAVIATALDFEDAVRGAVAAIRYSPHPFKVTACSRFWAVVQIWDELPEEDYQRARSFLMARARISDADVREILDWINAEVDAGPAQSEPVN